MKYLITALSALCLTTASWATPPQIDHCGRQLPSDKTLVNTDFRLSYEILPMTEDFNKVYFSEKRLFRRAYFDPATRKFYLPQDDSMGGPIELPIDFVNSVTRHIQNSFAAHYIQFIFFPDMGHSHFLIPDDAFKSEYFEIPYNKTNLRYEKMFRDPRVKVLYHTAERLKMLDENKQLLSDSYLQWRFDTRNIVGSNSANGQIEVFNAKDQNVGNVLDRLDGYTTYSPGFNLSANQNGCFSFSVDGKDYFYDISLYDIPVDKSDPNYDPNK